MIRHRRSAALISFLLLVVCMDSFAITAKKDFRGLFGNYRREQYVENEGRSTDVGFDLQLSTLLPITSLVQSIETVGGAASALNYAAFFNFELGFFLTLNYHWELYASLGYYSYETRKENAISANGSTGQNVLFHNFEMQMVPAMGGIRYRLMTEDLVPYIGIGAGLAYTQRKGFYENQQPFNQQFLNVLVAQAVGGVEFFIASRVGIRLELSVYFMNLPSADFRAGSGALIANLPDIVVKSNPWSVRYSSGLFVLF